MSKGFKKFPFAWRKKWVALFQESPTAAAVWDYMYWRSDEKNVFDLCEELICGELRINPKTLSKARATIEMHHGFKRRYHYKDGQRIVTYLMLPFVECPEPEPQEAAASEGQESKIPENGTQADPQDSVSRLDTRKRYHTVDTPSNGESKPDSPIPGASHLGVDTVSKTNEQANEREAAAPPSSPDEIIELEPRLYTLQQAIEPITTKAEGMVEALVGITELLDKVGVDELDLLRFNRSHKKGNLVIHTIRGYFNAVTKGMSLVNDYLTHQPCEMCKKAGVLGKAALDEKREQEARLVEEARQLQAQKAWYDAQVGLWDFTPIPMGTSEVMDQFRDIIRSGSDGKWLPDGFKLTHKLNRNRENEVIWSDDTPEVWSAAIRRVVSDGKFVSFEQFNEFRETAHAYKAIAEKLQEASGMAFEAKPV